MGPVASQSGTERVELKCLRTNRSKRAARRYPTTTHLKRTTRGIWSSETIAARIVDCEAMIAATDCHYRLNEAICGAILFEDWCAKVPELEIRELFPNPAPYRPGSFYLRELPCLLKVLDGAQGRFDTVIVDGYVWLGPDGEPGLGAHLFRALGEIVQVVGIAKNPFRGSPHAEEVFRGSSRRPLFVTAAGIDPQQAAENVKRMHGPHRIPTLLKRVDRLCRSER